MPAQSKSQQRFFGVVKAMQKGDIPKKGKAGKIAKTMDKDDVDDFASTKHKGKPEKVKREMKVRNLIKKMVREELAKMNEVRIPFSSSHIKQLKRAFKDMKGTLPDNNPLVQKIVQLLKGQDKKVLQQLANADIKYLSDKAKDILGEGVNSSFVKKMEKAVLKGKDVVVYDKKGKKYSMQSAFDGGKGVAVTDYLGSERTYQELPMSKVKKIVIEGKLTSEQKLRESIREIIKEQLNEKTFGSRAQYDAYRKKHTLKPGSKHKVAGKTVTVRDVKKISKSATKSADKFAAAQNAKMDAAEKAMKKKKKSKVKEAVRASVARFLYIPKKDIKKAIKVVKSMPMNLKGKVEIEKKPSDKVKGFYAITTEKQLFNAVVEYLATADIGVKTISQGKM